MQSCGCSHCKSNKGEGYSPVAVHTVRAIRGRGTCKSNKGEGYSPVAVHTVRAIRGRGAVLWLFTL